ncbi:MAG: serine hydrolase domain-containing protein [Thermaurantiacus sp.]
MRFLLPAILLFAGSAAQAQGAAGVATSEMWPIVSYSEGEAAPGRPLLPETPVRIASVSKVVVALAVHRLAEQATLALDDPVSRHLGWELRHPQHPDTPITIRHLLMHRSGLSDAGGYIFPLGTRPRDALSARSFGPHPPGAAFDYANLGFVILGEMIEAVTGARFDAAIERLVIAPLGLQACFNWSRCPEGFAESGATLWRKAPSSEGPWDPDGPWIAQIDVDGARPANGCPVLLAEGVSCDALQSYIPGTNGGLFSPQGGLRIAPAELAKLGQMLLRNDGSFLSPETVDSLFDARPTGRMGSGAESDPKFMQYWSLGGLQCLSGTGAAGGDQPLSPAPSRWCGHAGDAWGLRSGLWIDREAGLAYAFAITGTAADPKTTPGKVSRFGADEERILRLLVNPDAQD